MPLSLWLTPSPDSPIYAHVTQLISELPEADLSLKSSPTFLPHITLLSGFSQADISCLNLPRKLAVSIKSLSFGSAYMKKVYFSMERSHALIELAEEARVKLNKMSKDEARRTVETGYDPHVSLMYNDVELNDKIKEAIQHIVTEKAKELGYTAWEGLGWKGGQFLLVRTEGPVVQWAVLKAITLSG